MKRLLALDLLFLIAIGTTTPRFAISKRFEAPPGIEYYQATNLRPSWSYVKDQPVITSQKLVRVSSIRRNTKSAASVLGAHQRQVGGYGYENITSLNAYGTQYGMTLSINGVPMLMTIDTASSDTWAAAKTFRCLDAHSNVVPQGACGFAPPLSDDFQYGRVAPAQHMYIRYGDGEVVTGPMGYSDVTIANLTVRKQQVALANMTHWNGNNVTTGLLGLGFPSLTSSFLGTDVNDHSPYNELEYSPIFTSMYSQGLVQPLFSVTISRNSSNGVIAFGGTPYVTGLDYSTTAYMPILIVGSRRRSRRSWIE